MLEIKKGEVPLKDSDFEAESIQIIPAKKADIDNLIRKAEGMRWLRRQGMAQMRAERCAARFEDARLGNIA
ncbi:unnamed protein product [Onchocerca flexuosa]|uniref:GNAT family N-acetyltransferase n=1 Tax=Onchocerca flexuosa TaxID=387005 RepID=A0A183GYU2_9BILA|nr:unnamed protein product [Onchocerca flexuosa]